MEPITYPQEQDLTLRPQRWRLFLIQFILVALVYVFGLLVSTLTGRAEIDWLTDLSQNWPIHLTLVSGASLLLAVLTAPGYILRLTQGLLEGPSGGFGARTSFSIQQIDFEKTVRSFRSPLALGKVIWSEHGERVIFFPWFYAPGEAAEFRRALRLI